MKQKTWIQRGSEWFMVSTVRLPTDHGYDGKPLWYETMVFQTPGEWQDPTSYADLDCTRYTTEQEAWAGHQKTCQEWQPE